ncbi:MAG: chromosome partitioning protein ParB [Gammaproteobacteria bacterium]|nr:MAG: chromosome partitioning protein ParB [Gammaproteobacteria bacterium]
MSDTEQAETENSEGTVPLTDWENPPNLQDLKGDLTNALPAHTTQKERVTRWLDNLHVKGSAAVNSPKGHSKIVPKLIRKQAEWRYASLSEPFLNMRDLFKVAPITWEDREAAKQNQLILNNQFNTQIDRVRFIDEYVRTAVDEGTVIVRVGWEFQEEMEEKPVPVVRFVPDNSLIPLHQELEHMRLNDPTGYRFDVPEELKSAHEQTMEHGVPYRPVIVGKQLEKVPKTIKNRPVLEVCDSSNVIIDPSCMGDVEKARFIVFSFEASLSDLKKDSRYKNLDQINLSGNSILADPDHNSSDDSSFNFKDKAREKFVVHEYWGYWDIHNTGVVEPFVAAWVGDTLIRLEETPFPDKELPFVIVQYLPARRSIYGEPDGHLLEDNQKIAGAVTRGMIDIMARSANGQVGIRKDALDVTNRRKFDKGMDYEFNVNTDPRQAIFMHTYPEIPASAQFMLQLQNMEAEALTGVKAFAGGISGNALGDTATGIRGALDAASKRELGILRRLSGGMVKVARKILSMNAVFLDEEEVVRVTNEEFVPVRRDDLAGNFDLSISISTAEEDNAKASELSFVLQTTGPNMDPAFTRLVLSDLMDLRKMPDLAERVRQYEPQPDPFQQEKQALELELLRKQIQEIDSKIIENRANAKLDNAKATTEGVKAANIQSDTDQKTLNFVEQESGVTQERELQKHGAQAKAQAGLKLLDSHLKNRENTRTQLRDYLKNSG